MRPCVVSSETVFSYLEEALVDSYKCNVAEPSAEAVRQRLHGPQSKESSPNNDGGATTTHVAAGVMDGVCGRGEGMGE